MNKTLILIRHAHALSRYEAAVQTDDERPLSEQGRQKAARSAQTLNERALKPQKILTSPLLRAVQTAQILADTFHVPVEQVPLLDGFHPDMQVHDFLLEQMAAYDTLIVVGHNPCISYVTALFCGQVRPFAPASFAIISLEDKTPPQLVFFGD